jgi:hypothetical protein
MPLATPGTARNSGNAGDFGHKAQESQESQGVDSSTAPADDYVTNDFPLEPKNAEAGIIGTIGTAYDGLLADLRGC